MNESFIVGCVQTTSSDNVVENIAQIAPMAQEAVERGARLIALPENAFAMRREGQEALSFSVDVHAGVQWARGFCAQHKVWVLIGSIRAKEVGVAKPFNRSLLISPEGNIAAQYDKIHLFDVTLPDGTVYAESAIMAAGKVPVVANLQGMKLGMSVCYDVRFATQYRVMAEQGAQMFAVPSAFTRPTGAAHWHTLLRARAIENVAYVIAPAQCGEHAGGRTTYGHSLIIDPWGVVLAEADDAPCVITAEVDAALVTKLRQAMPVLA